MSRTSMSVLGVCLLVAAGLAVAAEDGPQPGVAGPGEVIYDAQSAFAFLKSMAGEWQGSARQHDHGAAADRVEVRTTAAGSAVLQTLYPGAPQEMLNVFHLDGDTLLLTHYCAAQNAPVMKFVPSETPGEIRFEFAGGTNFDPAIDVHAHEGSFFVEDQDTVASKFVTWAGGKPQPVLEGMLVRKSAG